jgi:gamma-glutamylputrescine oxidase
MDNGIPWQSPPAARRRSLVGDVTTDVAIVGGGIGGLATAWHLAGRGIDAVVVEAGSVAAGASGRNGGFLIAGAAPMYNDARERFGPELARRIYAATLDAQREVYAVAEDVGATSAFRRVGMLRLAVDAAEAKHVRAHAAALAADGFPARLVEAAELPEPIRRPDRVGLMIDDDAGVHPVRWLRALAAALEARRVRIYEGTAATLSCGGLATAGGSVRARATVVAADAAAGALAPGFAGRIRPRRLHMIATGPLRIEHVRRPVYARYGYEYHQQLPDGRIVLGGFSDLDGEASYTARDEANPAIHARLAGYLADELGVDGPVMHRWVGTVGYTDDGRPFAGGVPGRPGLYVMGGYSGTGNLCAWVGGRIVAELIASGSSRDADLFDAAR